MPSKIMHLFNKAKLSVLRAARYYFTGGGKR